MEYNKIITILRQLGIHKPYKGCEYIISSVNFIAENECFDPVTKVLYVGVAKQHHTSSLCVERNIRSVIEMIWEQQDNKELICKIFGEYYLLRRPSNVEFLTLLYEYIKLDVSHTLSYDSYKLVCPLSGGVCAFYNEFVVKMPDDISLK